MRSCLQWILGDKIFDSLIFQIYQNLPRQPHRCEHDPHRRRRWFGCPCLSKKLCSMQGRLPLQYWLSEPVHITNNEKNSPPLYSVRPTNSLQYYAYWIIEPKITTFFCFYFTTTKYWLLFSHWWGQDLFLFWFYNMHVYWKQTSLNPRTVQSHKASVGISLSTRV